MNLNKVIKPDTVTNNADNHTGLKIEKSFFIFLLLIKMIFIPHPKKKNKNKTKAAGAWGIESDILKK